MKLHDGSTLLAVTAFQQFNGRGHWLTTGGGWKEVAGAVLAWLKASGT